MIDYTRLQPDELAAQVQGHMDEVVRDYATLNQRQLNWTVHPARWSVGQCLDHLVTLDRRYLDRLGPAVARARDGGRLSSGPHGGTAFGRWFTRQVGPMIKLKLKAPGQVAPAQSEGVPDDIADRFVQNERELLALLDAAGGVDLQRVRIGSPIAPVFRFTAIDALRAVVAHQRRHLDQASRVREHPGFPRKGPLEGVE